MHAVHFGVYGWRARREDGFDEEGVTSVAAALGLSWGMEHPGGTVLVGYDTRYDSEGFALLVAGLLSSYGLRAKVVEGPCPSPALEWSVARDPDCVGGVLVSGGDFSSDYNGMFACGADGGSLTHDFAREVDRLIMGSPNESLGTYERVDLLPAYLDALRGEVDCDAIASAGFKVVMDPMYGTSRGIAAEFLRSIGCDVTEIHADERTDFDGIHPQPVEPWLDECEQVVVANGADVGISLGGIGRRVGLVDERGRYVSPHNLVPIVLEHLVRDRGFGGRVVSTIASSARLERQAERLGLDHVSVPVGFESLYAELHDGGVLLAAEEYGGITVPRHLMERDAILTALYVLELLATTGTSASEQVDELTAAIGPMYYGREDLSFEMAKVESFRNLVLGLNPRQMAGMRPVAVSHADGLKATFEDGSWALIRPSRSQSLIRVYAEAPTIEEKDALLDAVSAIAAGDFSSCVAE